MNEPLPPPPCSLEHPSTRLLWRIRAAPIGMREPLGYDIANDVFNLTDPSSADLVSVQADEQVRAMTHHFIRRHITPSASVTRCLVSVREFSPPATVPSWRRAWRLLRLWRLRRLCRQLSRRLLAQVSTDVGALRCLSMLSTKHRTASRSPKISLKIGCLISRRATAS